MRAEARQGKGQAGRRWRRRRWKDLVSATNELGYVLVTSPLSFQVVGADVSSRGRTGTVQQSSRPWQEEPAAKIGREASAMQADPCNASSRCSLHHDQVCVWGGKVQTVGRMKTVGSDRV